MTDFLRELNLQSVTARLIDEAAEITGIAAEDIRNPPDNGVAKLARNYIWFRLTREWPFSPSDVARDWGADVGTVNHGITAARRKVQYMREKE